MSAHHDFTQVRVEARRPACCVTIDRAAQHNTLTNVVMQELTLALQAAEAMPGVRAIVITGASDKSFCAGGALKPTVDGAPFALEPGRFDNPVAELFRAMDRCNLPIFARVNGGAFGGGLGLVCACDFAVAADSATFGTTEARVGVFPMMTPPVLMRVIPRRRLLEMCCFAERFPAARAQQRDLLNEVLRGMYVPLIHDVEAGFSRIHGLRSGLGVPQIAVVLGHCTAGGAYIPALSDYSVIVRGNGGVFLGGPLLVKAATGEVVAAEALGGADMHTRISGTCNCPADDVPHALAIARDILA